MELVNQTPAAADLRVSTLEGTTFRYGMLTAKVTFCVDREGRWRIDDQDPYPVLAVDRPTALGELPGDLSPRRDRALEVIVLGAAHGGALTEMEVSLAVGGHARHLRVSGDREWLRGLGGPRISPPAAIGVMPLTWARAFGGAAECWLDERSVIDLFDPQNRRGRGFDAEAQMRDVGKAFEAPAGFPRLADGYRRLLPNIEDPRRPITRWDDAPPPACWATVPTELGVQSR
ncbi:MAG: DUF2169 domain-containing protein, partial [Myxococcales bacterium]|nr:DUF2169 domain-containing protein [Myxococcales bacterium]